MTRFLIYLFESGLCLTLFYSGYILFFRKETYFTFNRIYLMLSMILALLLPLTPVQFSVDNSDFFGITLNRISEFRNYYEELILMTEPAFRVAEPEVLNNTIAPATPMPVGTAGVVESSFSWSSLIFYTYIIGLLFFAIRLLMLLINLYLIIRRNKVVQYEGFSIVLINEESPSFSFLRWIFVNKEVLKEEEFEQVIAHEKVHVKHKHTVDLLLAHIITIFQWFNPLTWRIQKSIKTCHEYIADRQVIDQGHELFDYQSLLLSQLISIRSVELVNNFNLLSIKKRIAMMNKIKSGLRAQLKALLVFPLLIVAFFFFANMTHRQEKIPVITESSDSEFALERQGIDIPVAKSVKVYDYSFVRFNIQLSDKGCFVKGQKTNIDKLGTKLAHMQAPASKDVNKMSILLEIDKSAKMKEVDKLKTALRENDLLKIGYLAKADESTGIEGSETALFNLLPPKEAKMFESEDLDRQGIKLFKIKYSSSASLKETAKQLHKHVMTNKKYVMLYEYSNATTYNEYIQTLDMVYSTIWNIRKEHAFFEGLNYDSLTKEQEIMLRKKFPLTLTMKNVDEE
ncbi:M56 family metallopeptidase [Carboxylicivirga sediminis]|uniref:M56 family metallopeptidase n=1 Tax=Carboxylicivirga sediminis TaxID=2006564 RepID=A0A941IZA7_9BACT|nr:M56 family metallopeptidase [Carboxylicivirga sediminis]MBR8537328.1 M56 family metallopeptidase [Carboxylicivirga sediminis]